MLCWILTVLVIPSLYLIGAPFYRFAENKWPWQDKWMGPMSIISGILTTGILSGAGAAIFGIHGIICSVIGAR